MIALVILSFVSLFTISNCEVNLSVPGDNSNYKDGDRFIWFPDEQGKYWLLDLNETLNEEILRSDTGKNNFYVLFTRLNPTEGQHLYLGDLNSLRNSNFDPSKETKFIIHGWLGSATGEYSAAVKEAYLQVGDYNVFVVDWHHMAQYFYFTAVSAVPSVGFYVGVFIFSLIRQGAEYEDIHIIGYSLGAHVAGSAGKALDGRIARITGLDPAGPFFSGRDFRIMETDGRYVEIIHTNIGVLGYYDQCGDADFYPNGGINMPGCSNSNCDHSRAFQYFAASLKYNHLIGTICESVEQAVSSSCNGTETLPLGNPIITKYGRGIYGMETGLEYPY